MIDLVLLSLASWRLTSLIVQEDGPFDIFIKIRLWLGVAYDQNSQPYGKNVIARGILCMWCASVWVSFVSSFFSEYSVNIHTFVINWLAISGGVILIESLLAAIHKEA